MSALFDTDFVCSKCGHANGALCAVCGREMLCGTVSEPCPREGCLERVIGDYLGGAAKDCAGGPFEQPRWAQLAPVSVRHYGPFPRGSTREQIDEWIARGIESQHDFTLADWRKFRGEPEPRPGVVRRLVRFVGGLR